MKVNSRISSRRVIVPLAVVHVDDSHDFSAAHQRHRGESVVGIFDEALKILETGIGGGVGGERDNGVMLGDPAGDSFAQAHAKIAEVGRVGNLGSAQDDFMGLFFQEVNQARIAGGDLHGEAEDLAEHLVERQFRTYDVADSM